MTAEQQKPKRIPYGKQNWEDVRLSNFYYVDKTRFIPEIEAANEYFFFIRPRRFGKSLLMNMLRQYYDLRKADLFDRLFGDLWIGQHPTPEHNTYLVLHLNFAAFSGSFEGYQERMDDYCRRTVTAFIDKYADLLPDGALEGVREQRTATDLLDYAVKMADKAGQQIYLFIDEYDHFTNIILSDPGTEQGYKAETHGAGAFRAFFNAVKSGTDTAIKRLFVTGVSPVTMDDLTSGFNIGTNYTMNPKFNALVGFTETEVRTMLDYYRQYYSFKHSTDELIEIMKPWYDNYCFAKEGLNDSRMFNSDMVLYYLGNQVRNGHSPDEMVNPNARTDYKKMKKLIQLDKLEPQRKSIIYQIAEQGYIDSTLVSYFPASEMVKFDNFVSLLYYYGMLTIAGTSGFMLRLGIPNNNVRKQYYGYLLEEYDRIRTVNHWQIDQAFQRAAVSGDWHPLVQTVSDEYEKTCAVRCLIEGERNIQGFFTAYFSLCPYYLTAPEVELNHGYCDFFLMPDLNRYPMVAHSYIIELKYLKTDDSEATAEEQWQQAREQLLRYAQDEKVRLLQANTQLHLVAAQFRTHQLVRAEEIGD